MGCGNEVKNRRSVGWLGGRFCRGCDGDVHSSFQMIPCLFFINMVLLFFKTCLSVISRSNIDVIRDHNNTTQPFHLLDRCDFLYECRIEYIVY
jgi:hypothetical protein